MKTRRIGPYSVGAVSVGAMRLSIEGRPGREQAVQTIHAALDAGANMIDTAYGYRIPGEPEAHNHRLIRQALETWEGGDSTAVVVATKGGHLRAAEDRPGRWSQNGHPDHLKLVAEWSLGDLGVEALDLYYYHRPDLNVPYADSAGALKDLYDAGLIKAAGVSNVNPDQLRIAHEVLGDALVVVQNHFSPAHRASDAVLELSGELGLAFIPYHSAGGLAAPDGPARFGAFHRIAAERQITVQRLALAWQLALGDHVVTIPGTSRPASILDSLKAADDALSPAELAALNADVWPAESA
ncbi:MAG: aldo/keto reductase [Bifidobacteriaceae bacterium]|jgi:aryl-alcohol dehydrogenase-like predicted oxidoreductase|nr:aldo/keto reductase [Bifidobacteriaceae bacterium]